MKSQQYVCAGELVSLQTLTNVLNFLKKEKIDIGKLTQSMTVEKVKEMLCDIVDECHKASVQKQKAEGYIKLERGYATIPLPGIDVPFHSRYLWAGVMPFCAYLSKKINPAHINPDLLSGKYVPNLIAEPFQVFREYAQRIYDQTSSPRLDKVLKAWEEEAWDSPAQRQQLTYTILVELLAYQFASPVRWIETQDLLFTHFKFERLVEIGPSPTLTGMATRTLKAKYGAQDGSLSLIRSLVNDPTRCHFRSSTRTPITTLLLYLLRHLEAKKLLEIESFDGGNDFSQTPSHFNQPDNHALCKNLKPIEQVLKDASTKKEDIDDVVLVGGSSRMSKVQPLLKDIFNGINPTRSPIRALPSLRIEGH
ncbi:3-oxoacyl-[acyl-carrier-protein] synthase [Tulasnella sp. 425]|nr:3-oxoacyl-[acyl-carrier-protein] synthase [Tulasnella sp. 425]